MTAKPTASDLPQWVLRWRTRRGVERPVVERVTARDIHYNLGRPTKLEVIEGALTYQRRKLVEARESVARLEQYVAQLEKMLAKESP